MHILHLPLAIIAVVALAPSAAAADSELSEHTAELIGDPADTIGVVMHFDAKGGWSMDYRDQPGAAARRVALPFLPADHSHYWVVVGQRRKQLVFIVASRPQLTVKTAAIWVTDGAGKVAKEWPLGAMLSAKRVAGLSRSISHTQWLDGKPALKGRRIVLRSGGQEISLDSKRLVLKR